MSGSMMGVKTTETGRLIQMQAERISALQEAGRAVLRAQSDYRIWAEAGVLHAALPYSEADLRKASLEAFAKLKTLLAEPQPECWK